MDEEQLSFAGNNEIRKEGLSHESMNEDDSTGSDETATIKIVDRFFQRNEDKYIVQHHPKAGPNGRRPRSRVIYTIHGNPIPMSYIDDRDNMTYSGDELELWTELIRSCRDNESEPYFVGEGVTVSFNVYLTNHIPFIEMNLLVEIVPQLLRMMNGIVFENDTVVKSVALDKSFSNDLVGSMELIVSNLE